MKSFKFLAMVIAAATTMSVAPAYAGISLLDASMYPTLNGTSNTMIGDVTFQSAGGNFKNVSAQSVDGVGVDGLQNRNEIEIGESINMSFANDYVIDSFVLSLLYNGPEFGDVLEIAQVTANGLAGSMVGTLTVSAGTTTSATWSLGGVVTNLSPADQPGGGSWMVSDPFGAFQATSLGFTALYSAGCDVGACDNQSDYILSSVTAVPEPETYALMLAGLAAVVFMTRRRRQQF